MLPKDHTFASEDLLQLLFVTLNPGSEEASTALRILYIDNSNQSSSGDNNRR